MLDGKSQRVPQLVAESAGGIHPLLGKRDVLALGGCLQQSEPQRIGPVLVGQLERID
jgi:hypothetical protein